MCKHTLTSAEAESTIRNPPLQLFGLKRVQRETEELLSCFQQQLVNCFSQRRRVSRWYKTKKMIRPRCDTIE